MIQGHGGNIYQVAEALGCSHREVLDMSSNVCPLGMVPGLKGMLEKRWGEVVSLPEVDSRSLRACFAASFGLLESHVLVGNGTTEFIYTIPPALKVKNALIVGPTYSDYADACRAFGIEPVFCMAREENNFEPILDEIQSKLANVDTVFICNPNNPTGRLIPAEPLKAMVSANPNVCFVVDESYLPFIRNWESHSLIRDRAGNIVVLHSFSKIFGIPGLRLGFLVAPSEIIKAFEPFKHPWNVNRPAQVAGVFLVSQKSFIKEVADFVQKERDAFLGYLKDLDSLCPFPSSVHFILFKLNGDLNAPELFKRMAEHKILIRDCFNFYGLSDRFFRIALKTPEENKACADVFKKVLT
ncbi:MAG: pyridoxal phosphate-dependent class II aminotransferase [Desulfobacterales bacterium]|nr:pyridoxal phosphate-dependent class II aminotransferase [Desulfobacterales bacterium]